MTGTHRGSAGFYLRDDGELRAQVMEANVCHVEAINEDLTLCGLQDSEQAKSHGRFASPSAAHNAYLWGMGEAWEVLSAARPGLHQQPIDILPTRAVAMSPSTSTFSPPCTCTVRFFSTNSRPGRYRTE